MSKTVNSLKKKADRLFSEFVRLEEANENGWVKCCTCDKTIHWKKADAGHFITRAWNGTRYYQKNVASQCRYCNRYREGEKDLFAKFLKNKYGNRIIDHLRKRANKTKHFTVGELEEFCAEIKFKIEKLKEIKCC